MKLSSWLPFFRPAPAAPAADRLAGGFPPLPLFEGFRLDDLARLPATSRVSVKFREVHGLDPSEAWAQYLAGRWPPRR